MANKEKKKVNKKLLIALAILVLIAVTVVLVIVLIPKKTGKAVEKTQAQAEQMFLVGKDEKEMFLSFQDKVKKNATKYVKEIESAETISLMLNNILSFYNDYLVFTQDNKVFQKNYSTIMDGFSDANSYQRDMNKVVEKVYKQVETSTTFTEGAWKEFKEIFEKYVKSYSKSISGLNKVLIACMPTGVINNHLTSKVLDTIDAYLEVINLGFDKREAVVTYASNFVNTYLMGRYSPIKNYKYSSILHEKLARLNNFDLVYGKTIKDVISSIDANGEITISRIDKDEDGVHLAEVVNYLKGGLSA